MDNLSKIIKAQLYERANSPLLASFLLSWAGWNYRFIMTIVSSLPLIEKFSFIKTELFPGNQWFFQGLLYPLLTTIFLIFVYPYPAKFVYGFSKKRQRELKALQQEIDEEKLLSRAESREIRKAADEAANDFDQAIQRKSAEIARLNAQIEVLEKENDELASVKSEIEIKLNDQIEELKKKNDELASIKSGIEIRLNALIEKSEENNDQLASIKSETENQRQSTDKELARLNALQAYLIRQSSQAY